MKIPVRDKILSKIYVIEENNFYYTDCIKNMNIGMHLDVYEPLWFKLGMMMGVTELYILILVYLTFTFVQGHYNAGKRTLLRYLCQKVLSACQLNLVYH